MAQFFLIVTHFFLFRRVYSEAGLIWMIAERLIKNRFNEQQQTLNGDVMEESRAM